ncbi:MAG: hypothetical protein ACXADB_00465 [Candidatus Hermodarchaeia archaeon]|jgi:hypothetical protein
MSPALYKTSRAVITPSDVNQRYVYALDIANPETSLVTSLKNFLETMGYSEIYPNFNQVRIGTIHPFSVLLAQAVLNEPKSTNQFPSITIYDSNLDEDAEVLADDIITFPFTAEHIATLDGYRQAGFIFVSDTGWQKISAKIAATGTIIGIRKKYHTLHSIDFNIWAENRDITSFLFDTVCHFITQKRIDSHNDDGIDLGSISGRRSGDINLEFGSLLYGANMRVQAGMNHEATLFDTAIDTIADVDTTTLPQFFTS